jgi:outer membrane receptor for ferrienterochelin and colicin
VGALARTFALRGLSPSQTLILVNGKRRHLSSSIYADSDPSQGSNVVDLDMIPRRRSAAWKCCAMARRRNMAPTRSPG